MANQVALRERSRLVRRIAGWLPFLVAATSAIVVVSGFAFLALGYFWNVNSGGLNVRESQIANQALRMGLWGCAGVAAAIAARWRPRWYPRLVVLWVALLVYAQPWWAPEVTNSEDQYGGAPLFLGLKGLVSWNAVLFVGLVVFDRWPQETAKRAVAGFLVVAFFAGLAMSMAYAEAQELFITLAPNPISDTPRF